MIHPQRTLLVFLLWPLTFAQPSNVINCNVGPGSIEGYLQALGIVEGQTIHKCLELENSQQRCFDVFIPPLAFGKVPLVMDIHGSNSCPGHMVERSGWAQKAVENKFTVVWPLGVTDPNLASEPCFSAPGGQIVYDDTSSSPSFTTVGCCCEATTATTMDLEFLEKTIEVVVNEVRASNEKQVTIDESRIYMAGHSNGCVMSLAMAAMFSDRIAAVACHAGSLTTPIANNYTPVPVMMIVGESDFLDLNVGLPPYLASPLFTFNTFGRRNLCSRRIPDEVDLHQQDVTIRRWMDCQGGADVVLLSIKSVGHSPYLGVEGLQVDTTQRAWEFCSSHTKRKVEDTTHQETTRKSDVVGKIICGYQGFYGVPEDGYTWIQWNDFDVVPAAGSVNVEMFPDLMEYRETFKSGLGFLGNNPNPANARVFSSYRQSTIDLHFQWMQNYGIDGIALQRFPSEFGDVILQQAKLRQLQHIRQAAESRGRTFYIMYDVTRTEDIVDGIPWYQRILSDLDDTMNDSTVLSSSSYAKHEGRPVVCIWGIGFRDELLTGVADAKPGTPAEYRSLVDSLHQRNYFVIGGVPHHWRTGGGIADEGFSSVYRSLDMISPWSVGRYASVEDVDLHFGELQADIEYCEKNGLFFQPVVYPGFSFHNGAHRPIPFNEIPRQAGNLMWRQFYALGNLGIDSAYVAMFDELNEGTSVMKIASDSTSIPHDQQFLTTSSDGTYLSSDFYLRMVAYGARMLRSENSNTVSVPIPNSEGPVWFRTGFEFGFDPIPLANAIYEGRQVGVEQPALFLERKSPLGYPGGHIGALRIQGRDVDSSGPAFVYFEVFRTDIPITVDTELSYWFRPDNENGRHVAVDLVVRSGTDFFTLRDSGALAQVTTITPSNQEMDQVKMHPGEAKGLPGFMSQVRCRVGQFIDSGRIQSILVAYDRGVRSETNGADFGAYLDDLQILGQSLQVDLWG